jgi:hypothetical protein
MIDCGAIQTFRKCIIFIHPSQYIEGIAKWPIQETQGLYWRTAAMVSPRISPLIYAPGTQPQCS